MDLPTKTQLNGVSKALALLPPSTAIAFEAAICELLASRSPATLRLSKRMGAQGWVFTFDYQLNGKEAKSDGCGNSGK